MDKIVLFFYNFLWLAPFILLLCICLGRKDERLLMRLTLRLPKGLAGDGVLWVHALSVGEVISALPLVKRLRQTYPDKPLVFTSTTTKGIETARKELGEMGVVLWTMPFDFIWCVRRVVRSLHPSLFVLVETDLWPGLLYYLRNRGVMSVLVNGRVSPRTLHGYKRTAWVTRWIFKPLGLCLMQTGLDASRLMQLDLGRVTRIRTAGNLKFDRSWAPMEDGERHSWQKDLGLDAGSEVWVAGSVHGGEEKVLAGAYHRLKISFPRLRLIIAPRRIEDAHGIQKYTTAHGWRVALRSELKGDGKQWDILVLDSLGELGRIYGLGALAFVGGSLVPVGGHNLLEPASFGCPVLFGPHTHNFQEMAEGLVDFGGGIRVSNETELCDSITMLLSDPERGVAMGRLAKGFVLKNQGALDRVMDEVGALLSQQKEKGFHDCL